jgi:hypothetical protein
MTMRRDVGTTGTVTDKMMTKALPFYDELNGTLYSCKPPNCIQKRDSKLMMQSLPLELKRLIVELSSESPNSLAALARTHTAYHREAEKALYHTLSIFASSDGSLKCLETLATNSEKSALVCFLIIEYARNNIDKNRTVTTYLSKTLINMHSLSDFRVRARPGKDEARMIKRLGKILWSVCKILIFSKLTILLCDAVEVIFD